MSTLNQNAETIRKVKDQLQTWGWSSELMSGYETRTNRNTPILAWSGITIHHTGGHATATSYMMNPRDRPELVVLCNAHITRDHKIKFIAAGGASHAGQVYKPNYDKTVAGKAPLDGEMKPGASGSFSANRPTFGIEVDGAGGNEWDEWMLGATVALAAAFHVVNGWKETSPRVTTHKELTTRKPGDPAINAGKLRTLVKEFIANPYPAPGSKPVELGNRLLSKNGTDSGPDVTELINVLNGLGYKLVNDGLFGPSVDAAVKDFQSKNSLAVDGIVGPETITALKNDQIPEEQPETEEPVPEEPPVVIPPVVITPPPVVEPPKPTKFALWVSTFNALDIRFGGRANDDTAIVKRASSSVFLFTEMNERQRDELRSDLDESRWKTWTRGSQAIVFDSTKYSFTTSEGVVFGPTSYHGGVIAVLTHKESKKKIQFAVLHLPPRKVASEADQKRYLKKFVAALDPKLPTILGGDFNTKAAESWLKSSGFVSSRATAENQSNGGFNTSGAFKAGSNVIDYLFGKNGIDWTDYAVMDAKAASDHNLVRSRAEF